MGKFELKTASRTQAKLKIGLFGPSGSGKTFSGLLMGRGLVGDFSKIAVIDTENNSASLYSHLGAFKHLDFTPPFDPRRYIDAIHFIEKNYSEIELIIIDSISHEWEGEGGCLQIHESVGGKFRDWSKVTPLHNAFVSSILQSRCHVILCGRAKVEYAINLEDSSNKNKVEKIGMKTITKGGLDYELTLSFRIDERHFASIDKDRTGLFSCFIPQIITEDIGERIKEWNMSGTEPVVTLKDLMSVFSSLDSVKQKEMKEKYREELERAKNNSLSGLELKKLINNIKNMG